MIILTDTFHVTDNRRAMVARARPAASMSRPKLSMSARLAPNKCSPCCPHQDMYCRRSSVYASRVNPL
jgi:hypothetical protein